MKKKISIILLSAALMLLLASCSSKTEETIKNYEDLCATFNETEKVYATLGLYPSLLVGKTAEFTDKTSTTLISYLYNALSSESATVTEVTSGEGTIEKTSAENKTEYVMKGVNVKFKYTLDDGTEKDGELKLDGRIAVDKANGEITTESLTVFNCTYRDMYLKGNLSKGVYEKATIGGEEVDVRLINNEIGVFIL